MKRGFFLRSWPVTLVLLTMFLSNVLLVSFVTVQALNPDTSMEVQATSPASPVPLEPVVIPDTGERVNASFASLFSDWLLWVIFGMAFLFFLFFQIARGGARSS